MTVQSEDKVCAQVIVRGRVQGVCFRMETVQVAHEHGVCGWVRNQPNGAVAACFVGEKTAVESVIHWCHRGPPAAHVDELEVSWQDPPEDFSDFQIRW